MTEAKRIAGLLDSVYLGDANGEAWHGAALKPLLKDVTAHEATRNVGLSRHTILQMVEHIAYWEEVFARRLKGEIVDAPLNSPEDWPENRKLSEAEWQSLLARLDRAHSGLRDVIASCSEAMLGKNMPSKSYDNYTVVQGLIHHVVYHTAQIVLLKKASRRDS